MPLFNTNKWMLFWKCSKANIADGSIPTESLFMCEWVITGECWLFSHLQFLSSKMKMGNKSNIRILYLWCVSCDNISIKKRNFNRYLVPFDIPENVIWPEKKRKRCQKLEFIQQPLDAALKTSQAQLEQINYLLLVCYK